IQSSAKSWTAAIYSYPGYRTVGNLGSLQVTDTTAAWEAIALKPGYYTIGLRYYDRTDTITMPTVQVDGIDTILAQPVDPNVNQVYTRLKERQSWFYRALHYYVYPLLRLRQHLPQSWIRSEFLPVGAPETQFEYGAIAHSHCLTLTLAPPLLQHYSTYLTRYNRGSFPLDWTEVNQPTYQSSSMPEDGFYLLRIRPQQSTAPAFESSWLEIEVNKSDDKPMGDR
ncbi:MAG: DUF6208 family protein, partial [Leptolyngbyaceae bacterium]|nr:DUF6208 family protein [Leptolyngbyaceae bacterium]